MPNLNLNKIKREKLYMNAMKLRTRPWLQFTIEIGKIAFDEDKSHKNVEVCSSTSESSLLRFLSCESIVRCASFIVRMISFTTETHSRDEQPNNKLRKPQKRSISIMSFTCRHSTRAWKLFTDDYSNYMVKIS